MDSILAEASTDGVKVRFTACSVGDPSGAVKRVGLRTRNTRSPWRSSATTLPSKMFSMVPPKSPAAPTPCEIW